jgi:hypothetical protein
MWLHVRGQPFNLACAPEHLHGVLSPSFVASLTELRGVLSPSFSHVHGQPFNVAASPSMSMANHSIWLAPPSISVAFLHRASLWRLTEHHRSQPFNVAASPSITVANHPMWLAPRASPWPTIQCGLRTEHLRSRVLKLPSLTGFTFRCVTVSHSGFSFDVSRCLSLWLQFRCVKLSHTRLTFDFLCFCGPACASDSHHISPGPPVSQWAHIRQSHDPLLHFDVSWVSHTWLACDVAHSPSISAFIHHQNHTTVGRVLLCATNQKFLTRIAGSRESNPQLLSCCAVFWSCEPTSDRAHHFRSSIAILQSSLPSAVFPGYATNKTIPNRTAGPQYWFPPLSLASPISPLPLQTEISPLVAATSADPVFALPRRCATNQTVSDRIAGSQPPLQHHNVCVLQPFGASKLSQYWWLAGFLQKVLRL